MPMNKSMLDVHMRITNLQSISNYFKTYKEASLTQIILKHTRKHHLPKKIIDMQYMGSNIQNMDSTAISKKRKIA